MNMQIPSSLKETFRSLRFRNFRLFMSSQVISMTGIWMQRMATGWLIYRLTESPFLLSAIDFASQIPILLLGLFSGVLVDRLDKRRLIQVTQCFLMLLAMLLAFLTLTDRVTFASVFFISICLGSINAFDMPARQACISQMVDRSDYLTNAIALNSAVFNLSRVIGPTMAGFVVAAVGEGYCFLFTGIAFCAPIYAFSVMRLRHTPPVVEKQNMFSSIKEGLGYIRYNKHLRTILALVSCISLLGMPIYVVFPVLVVENLSGGAQLLGVLLGGIGVGALAGTMKIASASSIRGMPRRLFYSLLLLGIGLVCMGIARNQILAVLATPLVGWGLVHSMTSCNTMLQTFISDAMRGRVMSLYSMCLSGMAPLGSIVAGIIMHRFGVVPAILLQGGACIVTAFVFTRFIRLLDNSIHSLYAEEDIIPE